jgi:hypothetical protein
MVDAPSFREKLEFAIQSQFDCKVRIHALPHTRAYEVLFKHAGADQWHEFILPEMPMHSDPREMFRALYTFMKVTQP